MSTGRRVAAGFACVLFAVAGTLALASQWVSASVFDTSQVKATTLSILREPSVSAAMSKYVTDELMALYQDNVALVERLPDQFKDEGRMIEQVIEQEIASTSEKIVTSEPVQQLVANLVAGVHEGALEAAKAQQQTEVDAPVTLDLMPVISDVVAAIQDRDILKARNPLPENLSSLPSEVQRDTLAKAIGVEIPKDFTDVEVLSAEDVAAQTGPVEAINRVLSITNRVRMISIFLVVLLSVFVLWISVSKMKAVRGLAIASCVSASIGIVGSRIAPNLVPATDDPVVSTAISDGISVVADKYLTWNIVVLAAGFILTAITVIAQRRNSRNPLPLNP